MIAHRYWIFRTSIFILFIVEFLWFVPWLRSAQNPWLRTALFAFSFSVLAACSELQATYKADSRIQWNPQLRNRLLTCVAFSMLLALAFLLGDSPYAFALLVLALILVIGYQIHLRRLSTTIASVWACTAVAAYLMYRFYR